jgi:signal transduction histidine kinase
VIPFERDGRPLPEIVHDDALGEPKLVEQVTTAIGLEVERGRFPFELEASERRSRALIDAMPDKMFRVSRDGIVLDIHENQAPSATASGVKVGASAYDAPAPRELIDRVMAAGRLALRTGELQTLELELGVESDLRHWEGRFVPSGDEEFLAVVCDVTDRKRGEAERAALHRVALVVAGEVGADRIFDLVAAEVGGVLSAHAVRIVRFEPGGVAASIIGSWHEPDALEQPMGRYLLKGSASEVVYRTGRPLRRELGDGKVSADIARLMRELKVHSLVAAPIMVAGSPWGVVVATLTAPNSFPPGAEERLGEFTQLVSLALANEEAREQLAASRARLVSAADEERRRLERNLHDGAQQRLVSLALVLRRAQQKLASDPGATDDLLTAASAELARALEELRELARGIHPVVLTERGLEPALRSLADRATLPVEIKVVADGRLPERVEAAAYFLVSEALTNVAKHAHASRVAVSIAQEDGRAVVEITDDGVGGADLHRGSGLRGLADRIEALDGTLALQSRPGEGTTICATIPLRLAGPRRVTG